MFGFYRKPLIFDLWANIRLYWSAIDYYSREGEQAALNKALDIWCSQPIPKGCKLIQFYRYEPLTPFESGIVSTTLDFRKSVV